MANKKYPQEFRDSTVQLALNSEKLPKKIDTQEMMDKIFKDAQKLLEKTLKEFDEFNKSIYA